MMRSSKLSDPVTVLFVVRYTLFLSAFIASGCAYAPQLVAPGLPIETSDTPGVRVLIGKIHHTHLGTTHGRIDKAVKIKDEDKKFPVDRGIVFAFMSKGELKFGLHWPFAEAKRVRINIFGRDGALLCGSEKFEDWDGGNFWWGPLSASSTIKKTCPYSDAFLLPPLSSSVEYRWEIDDRENEHDPDRTVENTIYILYDSTMCTAINDNTHTCTKYCTEIDPETHKCKSEAHIIE